MHVNIAWTSQMIELLTEMLFDPNWAINPIDHKQIICVHVNVDIYMCIAGGYMKTLVHLSIRWIGLM